MRLDNRVCPIVPFAGKAVTLAGVLGMQNGRFAVDAAKDVGQ